MTSLIKAVHNKHVFLSATSRFYLNYLQKCSNSGAVTNSANENFLKYDKDPSSKFLNKDNQKLLKSLTQMRLEKVYRKRTVKNNKVEYKFMTTEQIENEVKSSIKKANKLLQMPPIVMIREETTKVISKDPGLTDFDQSTYVFTDITFGINDKNRTIVVRHPDGNLETAPSNVRKRMNHIYFPLENRKMEAPRMFELEHFQKCLSEQKYEYILDRACIQFEPYEKEFHQITSDVYLHINETRQFDVLRSTRHFGPMCFFLAWHKQIDDLLIDMIQRDLLKNAVELVALSYKLNEVKFDETILAKLNELTEDSDAFNKRLVNIGQQDLSQDIENQIGKSPNDFEADEIAFKFVQEYGKTNSVKKLQIQASLDGQKESNEEKRKLLDGLQKAHGVKGVA